VRNDPVYAARRLDALESKIVTTRRECPDAVIMLRTVRIDRVIRTLLERHADARLYCGSEMASIDHSTTTAARIAICCEFVERGGRTVCCENDVCAVPAVGTYRPGFKRCGRCHRAWYCSRLCQQADWPRHRTACIGRRD
jgi:hypothetical protein